MRKNLPIILLGLIYGLATILTTVTPGIAHAADYNNSRLMDDQVFDNVGSMTEAQIQSFLSGQAGPYTPLASPSLCLANYHDVEPTWNGTSWTYGGSVLASRIIYKVAQQWGINPQVLISTLQKEESLITGTSCESWRYNSAMGYGCPDSGGCNPKYVGFTRQVLWGAWQLKFNKERAYGNTSWDGDGDITYVGYMTAGDRKRCDACQLFTYDGNISIDSQLIHVDNGTTASLYTYTPHLGQSFPGIFEGWFGSVLANPYDVVSVIGPPSTILPNQVYNATVIVRNNTSTTWYSDGSVPNGEHASRLATLNYQNSPFANPSDPAWLGTSNQVRMVESAVASGQNATFNFTMRGPLAAQNSYSTRFTIVLDGVRFLFDKGINMVSSTPIPNYSYSVLSVKSPPPDMQPNQTSSAGMTVRNTGNVIWRNETTHLGTSGSTRLITAGPVYRSSNFYPGGAVSPWLANNQISMGSSIVNPGETAQFDFPWKAPSATNTFTENFTLAVDGAAIMNGSGASISTNVYPLAGYKYSYVPVAGVTLPPTLLAGDSTTSSISVRNEGSSPWYSDGNVPLGGHPMRLARTGYADASYTYPSDPSWLGTRNQIKLATPLVNPGEVGVFNFKLAAPFRAISGPEGYNLVLDGVGFLPNIGMALNISTPTPNYGYQFITATNPPSHMTPGQIASVSVTLRNTGNVIWQRDSNKPFSFGAARIMMANPIYRNSAFADSGDPAWLGTTNQYTLSTAKVTPGQDGVFIASWKAPLTSGNYQEPFTMGLDGLQIFSYAGLRFDINVQ